MVFLDERDSEISGSTTWNSLLTGAQYNRELRLWSCANWSCIQTLRFCVSKPDPQNPELQDSTAPSLIPNAKPSIIMSFDWSKSLLVAADITRRVEILDVESASKLLRFHFPQPLATELNAVESEAQATNEHVIGWNRNQLISVLADRLRTCVSYACTEDHGNTVTALQISRDASCMASACLDGKVRVFSLFHEKDSISDILM
ncbi:hypothetical protein AHF37_00888 [Paragonimus kellicotti]|nr:hypothetical protein AHF37_00888 [Paragonimus kellicotti]